MTTSNPPPLLNYSLTTSPNPLQISTNGKITVVASNPPPGTYGSASAAFPDNGYVAVQNIVFDFGPSGPGESSLATASGSDWSVTPPAGWTYHFGGSVFTFIPPGNGIVSPSDDLSFIFSNIPVNDTLGIVTLTITETASTPGDPENPSDYPAIPSQTESAQFLIGKFPQGFTPSFAASPVNVEVGGTTTLAWSGLPADSHPTIEYATSTGTASITQHADHALLQADDHYPDTSHTPADPYFDLQTTTIFTLSVSYTPSGSSAALSIQLQVAVGVSYLPPRIQQFAASPAFLDFTSGDLQPLALTWDVQDAPGETPVVLTVVPPLDENEQGASENAIIGTARIASGSWSVKFDQPHVITLTAYGSGVANTAIQSIGIFQQPLIQSSTSTPPLIAASSGNFTPVALTWNATHTAGASPVTLTVEPALDTSEQTASGNSVFSAAQSASGSVTVQFDQPHLVTLTAQGTGSDANTARRIFTIGSFLPPATSPALPGNNPIYCVATTLDAQYALLGDNLNTVTVVSLSGSPGQWSFTPLNEVFNGNASVGFTPDGQYALVPNSLGNTVTAVALNGSPDQWSTTVLNGPFTNPCVVATTPDGSYALVANGTGGSVNVITLIGSPNQWTFTQLGQFFQQPNDLVVTPNGQYGLLSTGDNKVRAITLTGYPMQWTFIALGAAFFNPGGIAVTPDSRYALVVNADGSIMAITLEGSPDQWTACPICPSGTANSSEVSISPDGRYAFVSQSTTSPLTVISLAGTPSEWLVVDRLPGACSSGLAITPDGRFALMPNNASGNSVVTAVEFAPPLGWRCLKSDAGAPPNDGNGFTWTGVNYNDLTWTAPVFQGALGIGPWGSSSFASRPSGPPPQWMWWTDSLAPGYPGDTDTVYFRFSFYWPDTTPRTLYITADNQYTAYFNGAQISSGTHWGEPQTVSINPVAGLNVVAVQAVNQGGPGGLIAQLA